MRFGNQSCYRVCPRYLHIHDLLRKIVQASERFTDVGNRHISKLQQILTTATSNDLHPPLDKTYARNALLATVEYAFSGLQQEGIKIDQDGTSLRIFQLATYYLGQSKAGRSDYSIFLDIKKYLELLSMEEQHDLLSKRHDNCRMEHTVSSRSREIFCF